MSIKTIDALFISDWTMSLIVSLRGHFFLAAIVLIAPTVSVAHTTTPTKPNIVVIMTDDQRLDDLRVMTKTKALFEAGTTFSNYFLSLPWCCPSRATYLTGQYPHNHGVWSNTAPTGGYTKLNHTNTLPLWLQEAGYYTVHIGKYLNQYGRENPTEIVPGWDDWQSLMHASKMFNYTLNDNGTLVSYGGTAADYQTDVLADRAVDSINEAALRQPFFLSITPKAPHADEPPGYAIPAPRYLGAFADEPLPPRPSFNEADVSDKPSFIQSLPRLTASRINEIKVRHQSRLESLLAVDDLVQRVVNALVDTGVLDNTVLIFTSDNGYFHGEHRFPNNKEKVYEEAARVPLLIRGGGFPAGVRANQYVANIDLAPTIVSLAGATPRLVMDGRSLLPLAQNPNLATSRSLLIEHLIYKAVRNQSFAYVEHNTGERELYDMRAGTANYDPYQLKSRHANSNYNQIKSQLRTKLNQLRTCSGTTCAVQ